MTVAALGFIGSELESIGIPYEYMEFKSDINPLLSYWVGEYSETPPDSEDGEHESQFILTGTTKGSWLDLETQKELIEDLFPSDIGKTAILDNGTGIAIFFGNAFPIENGDAFLKRLQVNLTVKEWKVKKA